MVRTHLYICDVSNTLSISVLSSIACYDCYPLNNRVFPLVQTRSEMALYLDLDFFLLSHTPQKNTSHGLAFHTTACSKTEKSIFGKPAYVNFQQND